MTTTYAIVRVEGVNKRLHAQALRFANRATMQKHVLTTLGKHYKQLPETQPGGDYGYVSRSAKYLAKKQRVKGHQDPLVWSGRTKRHIRNNAVITATQNKATFRASNYFPMKKQMRMEIEAVSSKEEIDIGIQMNDFYQQFIAKNTKDKSTIKV